LATLGLEEEVMGITKFCVHPEPWYRSKQRIGGTKTVKVEVVKALAPDLIIANKEENDQAQVEELAQWFPVWVSDVSDLQTALTMIKGVGSITDRETKATQLCERIQAAFASLPTFAQLTAAYVIWREPYMVSGGGTFIHAMLAKAGFQNVFGDRDRYPEIELSDLQQHQPDVILLSSEPYPFKARHLEEFRAFCPQAAILLADGELFSWYGSRLLKAPNYFRELRASINE
jgi:ABC-type Fe3+-hydroxamate transport system substrate-binding protein